MKPEPRLAAAAPRYLVVAQALMRDIQRGRFKVGELLPTEQEICGQFGISRHTAREAIRRLSDAGLVSRRAGVGTIVKASEARSRYTASVSDLTELMMFNRQARLEVLAEDWVRITGELAAMLPGAEGQRWYRFTAVRHIEGLPAPVVHTQIIVHPAYEAVRDRIREPGVMVYDLLEQLHGERIAELKQEISAISLPRKTAEVLGARPATPALRVLRYYVGPRDTLLSLSINVYPHDRFKLVTHWRLDWDRQPRP